MLTTRGMGMGNRTMEKGDGGSKQDNKTDKVMEGGDGGGDKGGGCIYTVQLIEEVQMGRQCAKF